MHFRKKNKTKQIFKQKTRSCVLFHCQELFFSTSPASQYVCLLCECWLRAWTTRMALWSESYMVREVTVLAENVVWFKGLTSFIRNARIITFRARKTTKVLILLFVCFLFVSAGKRMYLQHCALRCTCLPLETLCIFVLFWLSHHFVFPHRRGTFSCVLKNCLYENEPGKGLCCDSVLKESESLEFFFVNLSVHKVYIFIRKLKKKDGDSLILCVAFFQYYSQH